MSRIQLTLGALVLLVILVVSFGAHHPKRGALYTGTAKGGGAAVRFRVSASGRQLTGLRVSGQLTSPCGEITIPGRGVSVPSQAITKNSSFIARLPLPIGGGAGRAPSVLIVAGIFGRDGGESGELQLVSTSGHRTRCTTTVLYSAQAGSGD